MPIIRCIGAGLMGLFIGCILMIPACIVVGVVKGTESGEKAANYVPQLGAAIGLIIGIGTEIQEAKKRSSAERTRAEEDERGRESERRVEESSRAAAANEARARRDTEMHREKAVARLVNNLSSSSPDRLRFEFEKRQRSIQSLQTKLSRLSREHSELWAENERWANDEDAGSYHPEVSDIAKEVDRCENEILTAEQEMDAILRILDQKWN